MKYIKTKWNHNHKNEPITLFSEISDTSWETRKVDVYRDGVLQYADKTSNTGDTRLSIEPYPTVGEINKNQEFSAIEINKEEFEEIWNKAIKKDH